MKLPCLTSLTMGGEESSVTNAWEYLLGFPRLQTLRLIYGPFGNKEAGIAARLSSLQELTVVNPDGGLEQRLLTVESVAALSALCNLRVLALPESSPLPNISFVATMPHLYSLKFQSCEGLDFAPLAHLPALKALEIGTATHVTGSSWAVIASLRITSFRCFDVHNVELGLDHIAPSSFPTLERVDIEFVESSPQLLRAILGGQQLLDCSLRLYDCPVFGDDVWASLARHSQLRNLLIICGGDGLSDESLRHISGLQKLERLCLSGRPTLPTPTLTGLTHAGLLYLLPLKALKQVQVTSSLFLSVCLSDAFLQVFERHWPELESKLHVKKTNRQTKFTTTIFDFKFWDWGNYEL